MDKKPYDYLKAVTNDVECVIIENYSQSLDALNRGELSIANFEARLTTELLGRDDVTGFNSGAYFCSSEEAEDALYGNIKLLGEALEGTNASDILQAGPDLCDMYIRMYLLGRAVEIAVENLYDEQPND